MKQWSAFRRKLLSDKKLLLLLAVFLFGVALLAFSGASSKSKPSSSEIGAGRTDIERELEERAQKLLSSVSGVGRVRVMITLEQLQEYRYAENEQSEGEDKKLKREYVIVENSGEKTGLVRTVISPKVRGVAVACEGGDSARVRQEVVNLICAAFGVSASRVYVSAYSNK